MDINRNSTLTNVCDAIQGTWERTSNRDYTITELKDVIFVRINVLQAGPVILPVEVKRNTPYTFYSTISAISKSGIIKVEDKTVSVESAGILEYIII